MVREEVGRRGEKVPLCTPGSVAVVGCSSRADTLCLIFQGTLLLWVPRKGLYLFAVFYTFGNIASLGR